jgi:hypothetical protein
LAGWQRLQHLHDPLLVLPCGQAWVGTALGGTCVLFDLAAADPVEGAGAGLMKLVTTARRAHASGSWSPFQRCCTSRIAAAVASSASCRVAPVHIAVAISERYAERKNSSKSALRTRRPTRGEGGAGTKPFVRFDEDFG